MTLLWIEGFETYGDTDGVAPDGMEERYSSTYRIDFTDIEAGRIAGHRWYTNTSSVPYIRTKSFGSIVEWIVGFAFKAEQLSNMKIMTTFEPGALEGINLRLTAAGEFSVYRLNGLLGTTSGVSLSADTWCYLELRCLIDNTAGEVELKVNETQELNLTGQDTRRGSISETNQFQFQGSSTYPNNFSFDDIYILTTTGSNNNDFLGNSRVDAIFPNAAGDASDFTPDSGSNYDRVDENPPDGDTSYVESSTAGHQDLYNYESVLAGTVGIKGIQINTEARETDAQNYDLKTLVKSGTTLDADAGQSIGTTSYKSLHRIVEEDPNTSAAWTAGGINNAQFGAEVA